MTDEADDIPENWRDDPLENTPPVYTMGEHHPLEPHYFCCSCYSEDHVFRFLYDPDDGYMYLGAYLHQYRNWLRRAWDGIRYIFGRASKHGHWDVVVMDRNAIERLHALCERSIAAMDKKE